MRKHRVRIWRAIGKRASDAWPPGDYRGEVRIFRETRDGTREAQRSVRLRVLGE